MNQFEDGHPVSGLRDDDAADKALVDSLVDRLDQVIRNHNSDRRLERRLVRIKRFARPDRGRLVFMLQLRWQWLRWAIDERHRRCALSRLDRRMRYAAPYPRPGGPTPSLGQIAADLRRLNAQRHGGVSRQSVAWSAAVLRAYDQRLQMACRCLDVEEHLTVLEGIDRDIERVRAEEQLRRRGLHLPVP
ncbi:hypothetical protein [Mangrovihabitans endophyticus]|uniref:Uncharacterized protein n=1 Tax=Mangrovihabitans endophyticus TaxID=1751298 RepID=A0A8J3FQP6_9ACTN|nr:hypothetical protein [Mangrovihabitans endophyticus]GGL08904.1 hypothetical protein GCM10012284_49440 [Mangrovihabitans endophyticus]